MPAGCRGSCFSGRKAEKARRIQLKTISVSGIISIRRGVDKSRFLTSKTLFFYFGKEKDNDEG